MKASDVVRASIARQGFDADDRHIEAWIRNQQLEPAKLSHHDLDRAVMSAWRVCQAVPHAESEAMAERYGLGRGIVSAHR